MRVLFLGGTRFIGRCAALALASRGHEVGVFNRGEHAALPGVASIAGDRARLAESRAALRAFEADVVVDMFAMTEETTRAAVDVFAGHVARYVVASSADVYRARDRVWRADPGPPDAVPLDEHAPLRATRFPYRAEAKEPWERDYDKILVEEIARRDLGATVLRLPAVYGPGDYRRRVWDYLQPIVDGKEAIPIDDAFAGWRWTRGYVVDVAHAIALAVEESRAAGRTFNVGESDAPTELEWAQEIARAAGWRGAIVPTPRERLDPKTRAEMDKLDFSQDWAIDTRRIRDELGFVEPVGRERGVAETVRAALAR